MLTARYEDHSDRVIEMLNRKLTAAIRAAAEHLADAYKYGLQLDESPEHSPPGQIPHRYLGHARDGYGPVNGENEPNNTPVQGFSGTQTDFLATYIDGGADDVFGVVNGYVGFLPSHVTRRDQNYLLQWDQGTIPRRLGVRRPWVDEIYDRNKVYIKADAKAAFEGTN